MGYLHSAVGILIHSGGVIQNVEEYELLHWRWSHLVNMLLCCSIRMCKFGDGMYFFLLYNQADPHHVRSHLYINPQFLTNSWNAPAGPSPAPL